MDRETIEVPGISEALRAAGVPLSPAVKAGGFVLVSGTPPIDRATGQVARGDVARQTGLVMDNLKAVLEAAGSGLEKVCKVTIFISNSAYYATVNEIYGRYFTDAPPARTFATVGSWPWEFDIEIECVALA